MDDEKTAPRPFHIVSPGEPLPKRYGRYSVRVNRRRGRRQGQSRRPRRRNLARAVRELHRKEWEASESLRHPKPSGSRGRRKRGARFRGRGEPNRQLHRTVQLLFRSAPQDELEEIIRDAWSVVMNEIPFHLGVDPNG